jgi:phenylalanyl-tRNA synthetase beta chain
MFLDITGTDFEAVNLTLNILSTTLADMDAQIESVQVKYEDRDDIVTPDLTPREWEVSIDYINDYIGLDLSADEMIECFEKVRLNARKTDKDDKLIIEVPPFRGDIMHPVDFSEECAIGYGYNKLEKTIRGGGIGQYHPVQELANTVRKIMIGAGYLEVLNFMLTNKAKHYDYMRDDRAESEMVQIKNPVSKLYNTTRTTLLHKLMETIQYNRSEEKPIRIFEVGDVILLDDEEETGARRGLHLAAASYHEDAGFTEIRSTLDFIMTGLGYPDTYRIEPQTNPKFITGRNGDIICNGTKIGEIGEVYPEILTNYKLEFPVAALEINLQHFL